MKQIIAISDPTVELDEISVKDVEFGTDPEYKPDGTETKYSKLAGSLTPFVKINGMTFTYNIIDRLEIDMTGFLPKIFLSVQEKGGMFSTNSFPKDGDLVSLLVRSESADFKPIRQDYRILDVSASPSEDPYGETGRFSITAILNIPELFVDRIKSFSGMSSFETLHEIAKDMNLGFASNEVGTEDAMNRVCPYTSYDDFILNDVLPSTYKDDSSFFTAYIDQYYYLNLVQVNDMFVGEKELDKARINRLLSSDYQFDDDTPVSTRLEDMYLSNSTLVSGTPNFINGYAPINNSGIISLTNGYRTYLQYYDKDVKDFTQYYIETLNTEGTDGKIILKGRRNEDHTKQIRTIRFGYQFNDNVHNNYLHAKLQNSYNNQEIRKLGLNVDLQGVNPLLYKNQIIPVILLTNKGSDVRRIATEGGNKSGEGQDNITIDQMFTGFYTIGGMKLIYDNSLNKFHTNVMLQRREYDIPDNN